LRFRKHASGGEEGVIGLAWLGYMCSYPDSCAWTTVSTCIDYRINVKKLVSLKLIAICPLKQQKIFWVTLDGGYAWGVHKLPHTYSYI